MKAQQISGVHLNKDNEFVKDTRKQAFEWVAVMFNDNEEYLTEAQYKFYREHDKDREVVFDDFAITTSGVLRWYKRPAEVVKERYPCLTCNTNGYLVKNS